METEAVTRPFEPDVPGSRSITARAVVCAALGGGQVDIVNPAECEDSWAIRSAAQVLGASVVGTDNGWRILGTDGRLAPQRPIDCRASGTTLRFLAGLSLLTDADLELTGTPRLLERPLQPLIDLLERSGKSVVKMADEPRIVISGRARSVARLVVDSSVSGQFVSGLLLAAPYLREPTEIVTSNPASAPFVMMTVSVMQAFGATVDVTRSSDGDSLRFSVTPGPYTCPTFRVEPDVMSANYFLAAAAMTSTPVLIRGLTPSTAQGDIRMLSVLTEMGCGVDWTPEGVHAVRPVGTPLSGVDADLRDMPDMSLTLAVVASVAESASTFTGLENLKFKESDRMGALVSELRRVGVDIVASDSTLEIRPSAGGLRPARIQTYDDHRVAMAFGLLTLIEPSIEIADPNCVAKTWPSYFEELRRMCSERVDM